jgi:hypothetical protein
MRAKVYVGDEVEAELGDTDGNMLGMYIYYQADETSATWHMQQGPWATWHIHAKWLFVQSVNNAARAMLRGIDSGVGRYLPSASRLKTRTARWSSSTPSWAYAMRQRPTKVPQTLPNIIVSDGVQDCRSRSCPSTTHAIH